MQPRLRFAIALILIGASVPLAWWYFLSDPPALPTAPVKAAVAAPAVARPVAIHLGEITGTVQLRHGADGGWEDAKPGDTLSPSDGVRTRNGSYAVLVGDETWEVKMEPSTEIGIGELEASITRLLLESGMAKATVRGEGRHTFEVRASNGDAVASTDGGTFTIANNGQGTVAVGAERGEVRFAGAGRVVIVRAGQQSIVRPGQAPSAPTPIPTSLLLKVGMPARAVVNTPKVTVQGDVAPGSQVEVQGQIITVDQQGHFTVPVTLKEGRNAVVVKARGVGGQDARSSSEMELDTTVRAPTIDKNLWK